MPPRTSSGSASARGRAPGARQKRLLACAAIALVLVGCTSGNRNAASEPRVSARGCAVSRILVPSCGAWWGVGAEPAPGQSQMQALQDFERRAGAEPDIVHFYEVGDDLFPTGRQRALATDKAHPRLLFFNWRPAPDRSWRDVANGDPLVDARIDREAAQMKMLGGRPFFLSIVAEPEDEVRPQQGSGYTAVDYADMVRHVVQRLRGDGVHNAVTVADYIGIPKWVAEPWFDSLYPGGDVIDWLGYDRYVRQSRTVQSASFAALVKDKDAGQGKGFLEWAARQAPHKPIMLAEWGAIADAAHEYLKVDLLKTFGTDAPALTTIKAFVFWASPRPLPVNTGSGVGTTELGSDDAWTALRQAVAQPYFSPALPP